MRVPAPTTVSLSPAVPPDADVIVLGGGASGMVAAISATRAGLKVLLCEQSASLGIKLLASGGARCNLTNTLSANDFMARIRPHGRFLGPALALLGGDRLRAFFADLGLNTVVHDGFRVWPQNRRAASVLAALTAELTRLRVRIALGCHVHAVSHDAAGFCVHHGAGAYRAPRLILATGGLALPRSGASGEGYTFAEALGHRTAPRYPAGVPLLTAEPWPARCTAHTVGKAHIQVDHPKYKRLSATGDLIFTRTGIRGPVVLDLSRELSPLLDTLPRVPLALNLCGGKNQEDWQRIFKAWRSLPDRPLAERLTEHLPRPLAEVLCELAELPPDLPVHRLRGQPRDGLIRRLVRTPLTVVGTAGYDHAFVTRGGVRLKEVRPDTLESKRQPGLYLCGEVLDIDGPCGGFNLQWAFASGYLAGRCGAPS